MEAVLSAEKLDWMKADRRKRVRSGELKKRKCLYCGTGGLYVFLNAAGVEVMCDALGEVHSGKCRDIRMARAN
jgi:hypothetical protein